MSWASLMEKLHTQPQTNSEVALINSLDIIRLLRSAGGALFAQAALHGQLIQVEWAEEKNRILQMLVLTLFGFACGLCLFIFSGIFLLALSWDTPYRIHAAITLLSVFALGILFTCYRFKKLSALGKNAFAATREELSADVELIKSTLSKN